ncbi:MAG: hypothetical protein KH897_10780 [Bacteroides sp.]|uniref:hypothetical protein n=1 Tax=Bacteroides sp. TaxID=29523 RepID=UPI0025BB81B4|nr:hypothetical protein [Bacteroides sp.]MBS6238828.1 hypothetical protein [Bacteroides sp.]
MKKHILLLPLVIIAKGLAACSGTSGKSECTIKGYLSFKEYKKVYLIDNTGIRIDSCEVKDGRFYLEKKNNIGEPYVAIIHMTAELDSTDQLDMPVAIEKGLDALQHCKDGVGTKQGITPEEIDKVFSEFYKQQILSNKDNAVGKYIYQNYGIHLNTDDKAQVKAQMGN